MKSFSSDDSFSSEDDMTHDKNYDQNYDRNYEDDDMKLLSKYLFKIKPSIHNNAIGIEIQGPRGLKGFDGSDGLNGSDGPTGPPGIVGPIGEIGPGGPKGDSGGLPGLPGFQGPKGKIGSIGPIGLNGPTGICVCPKIIGGRFNLSEVNQSSVKNSYKISIPEKNHYMVKYNEPFQTIPIPIITLESDYSIDIKYIVSNINEAGFTIVFLNDVIPKYVHFIVISYN